MTAEGPETPAQTESAQTEYAQSEAVQSEAQQKAPTSGVDRVPWLGVLVYIVLSFGLAWLVCLPLWLGDGLRSPLFGVLVSGMMFTPAIAALIVTFFVVKPAKKAHVLGLLPFRPVWRNIVLFLVWPVFFLLLGFGAFFLAVWFGWVTPDWSASAVSAQIGSQMSVETFMVISLASLPLGVAISTVTTFGEELGWRGFLTSALSPLGFWPSALIIGIIWGLWHTPIILLGYNFDRTDLTGVLWMCGFCIFVGILLQWARYATGNIWPAAVGHSALNTTASLSLLWFPSDGDAAVGSVLGVPGWILMAVVVLVLVVLRQPRRALSLTGRQAPPAQNAPQGHRMLR